MQMDLAGSLNIGHPALLYVKVGSAVWLVASTTVVSSRGTLPGQVTTATGLLTCPWTVSACPISCYTQVPCPCPCTRFAFFVVIQGSQKLVGYGCSQTHDFKVIHAVHGRVRIPMLAEE